MAQDLVPGDVKIDDVPLERPMTFVADLSSAASALLGQPGVALVSILLWSVPIVGASLGQGPKKPSLWVAIIEVAAVVFWLGWSGAERIFFLRYFEGKPVAVKHLLALVESFIGRFLSLALLCGVVLGCVAGLASILGVGPKSHPVAFRAVTTVLVVAIDFALTFVPSALAFTTRSVTAALRIGFAMIRQSWPRCALYVVCPPLALNMINLVFPSHLWGVQMAITAGLTVVALCAKGATAAFYLRERPSRGEDGAAHSAS